jgi:RNA polymerase sigma factor (sigma-70 family)
LPDHSFSLFGFLFCGCYGLETMNDYELLRGYAETGSESDFTELVQRYVDLIYSAALRQVGGDAALAQDVTQSVFIDLARKAASISARTVLTGWLYTSTRYAAAKAVRAEQRRHAREQEAYAMQQLTSNPAPAEAWDQLRPMLDEAMHELSERDRNAILLRYFEGRQLAEVGAKLGLSEDAARMRVGRALEKLRGRLAGRGVASTAAALAALLASQTVTAAPAGLAVNIAGTALASASAGAGSTLTILKLITMTKLKIGLISALVVAGVATPLIIQHENEVNLHDENQSLLREHEQLNGELTKLSAENVRLSNLISQTGSAASSQNGSSNELLKLRAEVTRLRQEQRASSRSGGAAGAGDDPSMDASLKTWATRVSQLKQRIEQMPEKKIPELQFVADKDWFDAVKSVKQLQTDDDYRQAFNDLRHDVKMEFVRMLQQALRGYAKASDGMLPTDLSQLKPYFDQPVDDAVLRRYSLLQTGKASDVPQNQYIVAETAPPVDDEYDSVFKIGMTGINSSSVNSTEDALKQAGMEYAQAHGGLLPTDPSQLAPYLKQPIDPAVVQKTLDKVPPGVTTWDQLKAALNIK